MPSFTPYYNGEWITYGGDTYTTNYTIPVLRETTTTAVNGYTGTVMDFPGLSATSQRGTVGDYISDLISDLSSPPPDEEDMEMNMSIDDLLGTMETQKVGDDNE